MQAGELLVSQEKKNMSCTRHVSSDVQEEIRQPTRTGCQIRSLKPAFLTGPCQLSLLSLQFIQHNLIPDFTETTKTEAHVSSESLKEILADRLKRKQTEHVKTRRFNAHKVFKIASIVGNSCPQRCQLSLNYS